MARLTVATIVVAVVALAVVFEMLRRRRLREKYALLWVLVSGVTVVLSVFPSLLRRAAAVLGIAVPSNLLFLASLLVLFAVSLQLSAAVGLLEEQTRRLAEEVGALRLHVDDLEHRREPGPDGDANPAPPEPVAAPMTHPTPTARSGDTGNDGVPWDGGAQRTRSTSRQ